LLDCVRLVVGMGRILIWTQVRLKITLVAVVRRRPAQSCFRYTRNPDRSATLSYNAMAVKLVS
jgi:hypothetical protein